FALTARTPLTGLARATAFCVLVVVFLVDFLAVAWLLPTEFFTLLLARALSALPDDFRGDVRARALFWVPRLALPAVRAASAPDVPRSRLAVGDLVWALACAFLAVA